jgi:hypothetical protein
MRAMNFSFLNDPSEVQYGRELLEDALVERWDNARGQEQVFLEYVISNFNVEMLAEVYVACFTKLQDDLSQWRAYGTSSVERYAIGFDSQAVTELADRRRNMLFLRVEYEPVEQRAKVNHVITSATDFIVAHRLSGRSLAPFAEAAAARLARIMPALKNNSYAREEEWRVVLWSTPSESPEFDVSRGVMRPFIRLPFPQPPPVVSLHVMAPARREIALKASRMLLRSVHVDVEPQHSEIPFAE